MPRFKPGDRLLAQDSITKEQYTIIVDCLSEDGEHYWVKIFNTRGERGHFKYKVTSIESACTYDPDYLGPPVRALLGI